MLITTCIQLSQNNEDKITQFQRATCTSGNRELAVSYLESARGVVDDAIKSHQADARAYARKTTTIRSSISKYFGL